MYHSLPFFFRMQSAWYIFLPDGVVRTTGWIFISVYVLSPHEAEYFEVCANRVKKWSARNQLKNRENEYLAVPVHA